MADHEKIQSSISLDQFVTISKTMQDTMMVTAENAAEKAVAKYRETQQILCDIHKKSQDSQDGKIKVIIGRVDKLEKNQWLGMIGYAAACVVGAAGMTFAKEWILRKIGWTP